MTVRKFYNACSQNKVKLFSSESDLRAIHLMLCLSNNSIVHTLNCLNTNQVEWESDENELIEESKLEDEPKVEGKKLTYQEEKEKLSAFNEEKKKK